MKFGIQRQKELSGAALSVRIYQIASILPVAYLLVLSGYPGLIGTGNVLTYLFELGVMSLSRQQVLLMSLLYRITMSEIVVCALLLVPALVIGLVSNKIFRKGPQTQRTFRIICIIWITIDLLLRLVTLILLSSHVTVWTFIGLAVRLVMLAFILLDLIKAGRSE